MKYLTLFLLVFSSTLLNAQSVSFYNNHSDGSWASITVVAPPGNILAARLFYNASGLSKVYDINYIKEVKNDTLKMSLVSIDNQRYLLVSPNNCKCLLLSDDKQVSTGTYIMDSYIYNPVVNHSSSINGFDALRLLKLAATLLL